MATTTNLIMNNTWQAIATAGEVTMTAYAKGNSGAMFSITDTATAPVATSLGHQMKDNTDVSLTLTGTERLWIKGRGTIVITASAPV